MAQQTVKARIQLKNDTEQNWIKAVNFIPLAGELIIYSADEQYPYPRFKVGDGVNKVNDLSFADAASINGKKIYRYTSAQWNTKTNFIPNQGDILIYTDKYITSQGVTIPGIKVGDGLAYCVDLPFIGDEFSYHIADVNLHVSAKDRERWNNKLNYDEGTILDGVLTFNRN